MSNEVNTQKFYKFLSNYQTDGKTWVDVADGDYGNDDGTVIKSEFRKFLNAEWNGEENGELSNDLINTFWKKIDTNTSASKIKGTKLRNLNALDKDETANLDKKLEAYVKLNEFVANNVKIPNVLTTTGSQWKWDVVDELTLIVENYVTSGETGDVESLLAEEYPAIANKNTAIYCAVEYQNVLKATILADYPEYKVADDNTLKAILEAYTVDANAKPEDIRNDIRAIVDAYFATAGLGDDSAYDLADLGYTQDENSALNDIQKTVLTKAIKDNLAAIKKEADYDKYTEIFDTAIQTFINNKLATATFGNFEELKNVGVTEFKATNEYKNIQNQILVDRNFRNIDENSGFYKALVLAFGEDLAQTIVKDGRYLKNEKGENVYTSILDKVQNLIAEGQFVKNGQIDLLEVQDYIIDQISKNLNTFFPNGYGDMDIEALNKMYDKRAEAASKEEDDEVSLAQHRQAAIDYCDALSKKSTALAKAVVEVFGANYKNDINKMLPSDISAKMTELKAKALEIGDVSKFTVKNWNNLASEYTMTSGESKSIKLNATVKDGNTTIPANRITYSATSQSGTKVQVDDLGVLNITAPNKSGYDTITIVAMVDGVEVGLTTISVKYTLSAQAVMADIQGWGDKKSEHLETFGVNDGKQLTDSSFVDLYNNDAIIRLDISERSGDKSEWNRGRANTVIERLTQCADIIVSALATANLDESILKTCAKTVVDRYVRQANTNLNPYWEDHHGINGNTIKYMNSNRESTGHRIVAGYDDDGSTEAVYMVRFKDLVDDILALYWSKV